MEISHINSFILLGVFLISLFWNKNPFLKSKNFSFYLGISVVFEIVTIATALNGMNNHWVLKIFLIVEFFYFNYLHFGTLNQNTKVTLSSITIMVLMIIALILGKAFNFLDRWFLIIVIFYFIAQNCLVLLILLRNKAEKLLNLGEFWISVGRLSYFILILFIIVGANHFESLNRNIIFMNTFLVVNIVANVLRYSAYTKSMYLNE